MFRHALLLTVLTLTLAACGPYVDPDPRPVATAGPEGGLQHTGLAVNHMIRIDPQ